MVVFPNAKINLGLNILRKRPDGFHDLASCFVPVPYTDVLEIIESKKLSFSSSGLPIPGEKKDNLCLKAYHLLQKDFNLPPVQIYLHKVIPIGAGLGGGSSDASFTLKCLDQMFGLFLDDFLLEEYAARLGSDCPFFIKNQAVMAYGTGNEFEEVSLSLEDKFIVLLTPPIHVATAEAYAGVTPREAENNLKELLEKKPVSQWKGLVQNDFEASVFSKYPAIAEIKDKLYQTGASYASMSGSGASVYGIFEQAIDITSLFPENYQIWYPQR
ncbi:4-(cytidine 5'-diphospho)-2-C-methyl-D-erythritol kinase [Catalinimonas niigatensis]|uniref:4-(cytidine 5'-diphospho)-2-C-methyl-D-erythritol kinase n=1 Tax=Catalinimonas niigatensis TaxID=1397264 RepID=UPI0026660D03|nr:4-(cytidine 5'-diphospho)-2-C-methyl-D-erythritol kinase [Catalinimonas niigatensis]WPP48623.1 4-(cytidine 5'-diphospho)-2-C-methyl-D-erythritol kinase [Catalinimonas niigatensis]